MKLSPKVLLTVALFHLAMGLGWLLGSLFEEMTRSMYSHLADGLPAPEGQRFKSTATQENGDIIVTYIDCEHAAKAPLVPVISLHESSALNSFATYPPEPMDYAVLFRHLYEQGAEKVYVLSPLMWDEEPDDIVKAAVGYELDRFDHKAIGLQMSESARTQPIPAEWQKLVIPPNNIHTDTALFPRADKLRAGMPQLITTAQTVGAYVENNEIFSAARDLKDAAQSFPLFVRWGDHILPTLPLIAAMNNHGLQPQDILLMDDVLLMGKRVYRLNKSACLERKTSGSPIILGTADIIVTRPEGLRLPDRPEIRKLLSSAPAVIVSEPSALSDAPDNLALAVADTIGAILAEDPKGNTICIPKAPAWVQWIFIIDALLLALWALMFRTKVRLLIWSLSIIVTLLFSFYFFQSTYVWVPFMVPVMGVFGVILLINLSYRFIKPTDNDSGKDEKDDDDDDVNSHPSLSPEKTFEEPNEVPIPHHAEDNSSSFPPHERA